jgi:hypothetical protein
LELVACVPTPAQEKTKKVLEVVLQAFARKETCALLLAEWRDSLAKEYFANIPELNSIKAPNVQVSKIAQDTGNLMEINFSDALLEAKKAALTQMIAIKSSEIGALTPFCDPTDVSADISQQWQKIILENYASPEHTAVLASKDASDSLAKSITALGANLSFRANESRRKKQEKKKNAKTASTAALSGDKKEMTAFVKEIVKRQHQASRDKKSGKGPRGAGPSKTKNQGTTHTQSKVGKKRRQAKNAKRGTSTSKQPSKP